MRWHVRWALKSESRTDIGLMVAYAYAAQFPSEVEKLVVMDVSSQVPGKPSITTQASGISVLTAYARGAGART